MRFLSGFFTGFITMILVLVIIICSLFLAVPIATYAGWVGIQMDTEAPMANASIVEVVQEVFGTISALPDTSLNDIKDKFGIDLYNKIKETLGIAPEDTTLDGLATCKLKEMAGAVTAIDIEGFLSVAKIDLQATNANLHEIISPILSKSITEITSQGSTAIQDVIKGVKISNVKNMDATMLPDIPIFRDPANDSKSLIDIFSNINDIKLNDVIETPADPNNLVNKLTVKVQKVNADGTPMVDADGNPVYEAEPVPLLSRPVGKISTEIDSAVKSVTLGELVSIYDNDVKDETTGDVIHKQSPKVLRSLKEATLETLSDKVNTLTLNDVLEIDANDTDNILNKLLVYNADGTPVMVGGVQKKVINANVNELGSVIDNAIKYSTLDTFIKIYTEDVYEGGNLVHAKSPAILIKLKDATLNNLSEEVNKLTLNDVLNVNPEDTDNIFNNLFVYNDDGTVVQENGVNKKLIDARINDLGTVFDNSIKNATLKDVLGVPDQTTQPLLFELRDVKINNIEGEIQTLVQGATVQKIKDWGLLPKDTDITGLENITLVDMIKLAKKANELIPKTA